MTNTSNTTFADVLDYVGSTENSDEIRALFDTGNARIRQLRAMDAAKMAATLKKGDKVETHGLKPKYLNGLIGEVVSIGRTNRGTAVTLDCGPHIDLGRYGRNGIFRDVPTSAVRPIEPQTEPNN
ncbi:hypothetical protein ACFV9C_41955 [Kribbella sp. NPDC059898]|uniref:hypothetical protein n=1 Tax=Kribbella sp. NPDC059898 TaxID=3346995 RepID=UPI00365909A6